MPPTRPELLVRQELQEMGLGWWAGRLLDGVVVPCCSPFRAPGSEALAPSGRCSGFALLATLGAARRCLPENGIWQGAYRCCCKTLVSGGSPEELLHADCFPCPPKYTSVVSPAQEGESGTSGSLRGAGWILGKRIGGRDVNIPKAFPPGERVLWWSWPLPQLNQHMQDTAAHAHTHTINISQDSGQGNHWLL